MLAALIVLVFASTFMHHPMVGGGMAWDFGNALGFLAVAGLLFQMLRWPHRDTARMHEELAYWVLGAALVHALWMLAIDDVLRVYLRPGAPGYMWSGLIALIALAVLCVIARMPDRMRVHKRYRLFRQVHRGLGVLVICAAGYHVLGSGFYLPHVAQVVLIIAVALGCCLLPAIRRWPTDRVPTYLILGMAAAGLFTILRNIGP